MRAQITETLARCAVFSLSVFRARVSVLCIWFSAHLLGVVCLEAEGENFLKLTIRCCSVKLRSIYFKDRRALSETLNKFSRKRSRQSRNQDNDNKGR